MKRPTYLLLILFAGFNLVSLAQHLTINVDTVVGCDPVVAKFSFTVKSPLSTVTSVLWDFGNGVTSTDSFPTTQYTIPKKYIVKLTVNDTDTTSVPLTIPYCSNLDSVPNVFTPNGDGINDQFKIVYNGDRVINFKVFTRAGVMIFNSEGKSILYWDGKLDSGELVSPGIYFYIIEIEGAMPSIVKRGFFYVFY